jgi:hypothetical protein
MYTRPTGPRSIGGVLDDAVRLYRESFRPMLPLLVAAAVLAFIPSLMLSANNVNPTATPAELLNGLVRVMTRVMTTPTYVVTTLAWSLLNLVLYGALFSTIDAVAKGGTLRLGAALNIGLSRMMRMFFAAILLGVALTVGFTLLVIPGIYLLGIFQLVFVALVLENASIFESFGISRRLIKGYWWRSATIVTVASIILIVLDALSLINEVVSAILDVFLVGWLPCVLLTMYYDLKLRHEGQDLATRVDALAAR